MSRFTEDATELERQLDNMIFEHNIDLTILEPYQINCGKCSGLCCVALFFTKLDGFPKNKEAGVPCPNLQGDYKCGIHEHLSQQKLKGCMAYDCFGAGQYVTGRLASLPDWHTMREKEAGEIFNAYLVVMQMHQTLWYLSQCLFLRMPQKEKDRANVLINKGRILIDQPLEVLGGLNIQPFRDQTNTYLKKICTRYQTSQVHKPPVKNLMGKNLKNKNLSETDFSMSLLIAADLEQANLTGANFLGADMRDTNIKNTDLSECLFLTQIQINAAAGNDHTILPPYLCKPTAWK